jgi:flavodoxin
MLTNEGLWSWGCMNVLVVYYSRTGTTRKVAEQISTFSGGDSEEIHDRTDRSGVMGYLRAGRDSGQRKLTMLEEVKKDPGNYDIVVLGTPMWNHSVSTPIRTYISKYGERFKKVAFFSTGNTSDNPFGEMESLCGKKPVATLSLRKKRNVEKGDYVEKTEEFVAKLKT